MIWNILSIGLLAVITLALVYQLATRPKGQSGIGFKFNAFFECDRRRCHIYREATGELLLSVNRTSRHDLWEPGDGVKLATTKH